MFDHRLRTRTSYVVFSLVYLVRTTSTFNIDHMNEDRMSKLMNPTHEYDFRQKSCSILPQEASISIHDTFSSNRAVIELDDNKFIWCDKLGLHLHSNHIVSFDPIFQLVHDEVTSNLVSLEFYGKIDFHHSNDEQFGNLLLQFQYGHSVITIFKNSSLWKSGSFVHCLVTFRENVTAIQDTKSLGSEIYIYINGERLIDYESFHIVGLLMENDQLRHYNFIHFSQGLISFIRIWSGELLEPHHIRELHEAARQLIPMSTQVKIDDEFQLQHAEQAREEEEVAEDNNEGEERCFMAVCVTGSIRSMASSSIQQSFLTALRQLAAPGNIDQVSQYESSLVYFDSLSSVCQDHQEHNGCEVHIFGHISLGGASIHSTLIVETSEQQTANVIAVLNSTGMVKGLRYFDDEDHYAMPNTCENNMPPPHAYPQLYKVAQCYHTMVLPYEQEMNIEGEKEVRYSWVVRTRWDLGYVTPMPPVLRSSRQVMLFVITQTYYYSLLPTAVYLPYNYWPFSDQFAVVPRKFASDYFTAIHSFYKCAPAEWFPSSLGAADQLLARHLKSLGVPIILAEFHTVVSRLKDPPNDWCQKMSPWMISGFILQSGSRTKNPLDPMHEALALAAGCLCEHKFRFIAQEFEESKKKSKSLASLHDKEIRRRQYKSFHHNSSSFSCPINHLKDQEDVLVPNSDIGRIVAPIFRLHHTDHNNKDYFAYLHMPQISPIQLQLFVELLRQIVRDFSKLLDVLIEQNRLLNPVNTECLGHENKTCSLNIEDETDNDEELENRFDRLEKEFIQSEFKLSQSSIEYSLFVHQFLQWSQYDYEHGLSAPQ